MSVGVREVLADRGGDLQEAAARCGIHLVGHVDHAAGSQVRIVRHLDDDLAALDPVQRLRWPQFYGVWPRPSPKVPDGRDTAHTLRVLAHLLDPN